MSSRRRHTISLCDWSSDVCSSDRSEEHTSVFFSSRRRHTRSLCDWSSDVCSSDLEYARDIYLQRGLDPERVHILGMPIDPKFTLLMESKQELQRKLGLEPGKPVILLVGGGEGARGLRSSVYTIAQARLPVQLLIITGRNKRLYVQLQRTRSSLPVPARVFGFVQNMPEMMHASDVIVTKAGPGTICEALACNLPVILSG